MVEVKSNFKKQHGANLICNFGQNEDTQSHLLLCKEITKGIDTSEVQYDYIFSNINKQEKIAKILNKILKQRELKEKLLNHESLSLDRMSQ